MNPGGRGCSEPKSCHCTSAWTTRAKLHLERKKEEREKERRKEGERKKERKELFSPERDKERERKERKNSSLQTSVFLGKLEAATMTYLW